MWALLGWLTLGLIGLCGWGATLLSLRRISQTNQGIDRELQAWREARDRHHEKMLALREADLLLVGAAIDRVRERIDGLTDFLTKQKEEADKWEVGAFLPDDKLAANLENQIRQSEDRFIAAQGPIRYSSRPSPTSGNPSRREPSIQRPRTSGNR